MYTLLKEYDSCPMCDEGIMIKNNSNVLVCSYCHKTAANIENSEFYMIKNCDNYLLKE